MNKTVLTIIAVMLICGHVSAGEWRTRNRHPSARHDFVRGDDPTFTGDLTVVGDVSVGGSYYGDGSQLTGISASGGDTAIWYDDGSIISNITSSNDVSISNVIYVDAGAATVEIPTGAAITQNGKNLIRQVDATNTVCIGEEAGVSATGDDCVFIGLKAGKYSTGNDNIFIGEDAGEDVINSGSSNVGIGRAVFQKLEDGNGNVGLGAVALNSLTTADNNMAIGTGALQLNKSGNSNVAMGAYALQYNTGTENIGVGNYASCYHTTGIRNTAIGVNAGRGTSGQSIASNDGVYIGNLAGTKITTGDGNIAIGRSAISDMTSGARNIGIGYNTGDTLTTGSYNIYIGNDMDARAVDESNKLNIGNLIFGTGIDAISTNISSGNIGIGVTDPDSRLEIKGAGATSATQSLKVTDSGDNPLLLVRDDGNVGIGTSAPQAKLDIDGDLSVDGSIYADNISVGTDSPSASFRGAGDIYATSGIKAMEGLYAEAASYGAGLEVLHNDLVTTYTNVMFGDATFTAATKTITDTHGSFDNTYIGQFIRIISSTPSLVGGTAQIIAVPSSTTIVLGMGTVGSNTLVDLTGLSFVVYPEPIAFIGDNGDFNFCVGESDDASFKICADDSTNEHALHLVVDASVSGNAAMEIEYDPNGFSDCSAIEVNVDITGYDAADMLGTTLDVIIDNVGATTGDYHVIDVAISDTANADVEIEALATHEGVDVIAQYLGVAADMAAAFEGDQSGGPSYTDILNDVTDSGSNVQLFDADNDFILLAATAKFDEINVINATDASHTILPTFEYIEDDGSWVVFTPGDDTDGFSSNGTIRFESSSLTTWGQRTVTEVVGSGGAVDYYWIKITRTRSNLVTEPIESTIQVTTLGNKFHWNKSGNLNINTVSVVDGITAPSNISGEAIIYVDTADGDLKVKFGDGTVKTLATD